MTAATTGSESTEMTETDPKGAAVTDGQEGNREAAAYRTRLRAAEAERDALAAQVAGWRTKEVEGLVGTRLLSPKDLWVTGVELKDLLAEDGSADQAKVDAAVEALLTERPHWAAPKVPRVPRDMGQGRREGVAPSTSWAQVFGQG